MRKLKLDVHTLRVESFEPIAEEGTRSGTVHGNVATPDCSAEAGYDTCGGESCAVTNCLTCLCPHTGPQPSCDPCSWDGCSYEVDVCA
jgi:hypothetical protein